MKQIYCTIRITTFHVILLSSYKLFFVHYYIYYILCIFCLVCHTSFTDFCNIYLKHQSIKALFISYWQMFLSWTFIMISNKTGNRKDIINRTKTITNHEFFFLDNALTYHLCVNSHCVVYSKVSMLILINHYTYTFIDITIQCISIILN